MADENYTPTTVDFPSSVERVLDIYSSYMAWNLPSAFSRVTFFRYGVTPNGAILPCYKFEGRTADRRKYATVTGKPLEVILRSPIEAAKKTLEEAEASVNELLEDAA